MSIAHIKRCDGGIKPRSLADGDMMMIIALICLLGSALYTWWYRRDASTKA